VAGWGGVVVEVEVDAFCAVFSEEELELFEHAFESDGGVVDVSVEVRVACEEACGAFAGVDGGEECLRLVECGVESACGIDEGLDGLVGAFGDGVCACGDIACGLLDFLGGGLDLVEGSACVGDGGGDIGLEVFVAEPSVGVLDGAFDACDGAEDVWLGVLGVGADGAGVGLFGVEHQFEVFADACVGVCEPCDGGCGLVERIERSGDAREAFVDDGGDAVDEVLCVGGEGFAGLDEAGFALASWECSDGECCVADEVGGDEYFDGARDVLPLVDGGVDDDAVAWVGGGAE